jgi:hypothetical protein
MFDLDFSNISGEQFSNVLSRTTSFTYLAPTKTTSISPTTSTTTDGWKTTTRIEGWKPSTTTNTTTKTSSTPFLGKLKDIKKTSSPAPSGGGGGGGGMPEPTAGDETEQKDEAPQMNQAGMMPSLSDPKVLGAIGGGVLAYMLVPEKFKMLGIAIAMIGGYMLMGKVKPQDIKEVKEKVQEKVKQKVNKIKK